MNVLLLTISLLSTSIYACVINVQLIHQYWQDSYLQFEFHNGTTSPVYVFHNDGETKSIKITGNNCGMKPTVVKLFHEPPTDGLKPDAQTQAFIDGFGWMEYLIEPTYVYMGPRIGISCNFGECGYNRG